MFFTEVKNTKDQGKTRTEVHLQGIIALTVTIHVKGFFKLITRGSYLI